MIVPADKTVNVSEFEDENKTILWVFVDNKRLVSPQAFNVNEGWCDAYVVKKAIGEDGLPYSLPLKDQLSIKRFTGVIHVLTWNN